jgi:hypothetical protein
MLLSQGVDLSVDFPTVEAPKADTHPYEMRDRDGHQSLFGLLPLSRETYDMWAGNGPQPRMAGILESLEIMERTERRRRHADCPLAGCEDFDGQRLFPVHNPYGYPVGPEAFSPAHGFTYAGALETLRPDYRFVTDALDRETALSLAAAINAPPHVTYSGRRSGKTATMTATALSIYEANGLVGAPYERPVDMRSPRQKKTQQRSNLERARPKRRLDGRR